MYILNENGKGYKKPLDILSEMEYHNIWLASTNQNKYRSVIRI